MIAGAQALWWLALPVLLLPIWWHRQKRRRVKAEPLATARFLPAAPPQQLRIWRWEDVTLLVLRCLLLTALIAWLAVTTIPWRSDTVLIDPALTAPPAAQRGAATPAQATLSAAMQGVARSADTTPATSRPTAPSSVAALTAPPPGSADWIEQQIAATGFKDAQRMRLPPDSLSWLQGNEHEWRSGARLLILATSLPMPAQIPQFAHSVDIRILPAPAATLTSAPTPAPSSRLTPTPSPAPWNAESPVREHHVALSAPQERLAAWRTLFAAFDTAGGNRYILADAPTAKTELIVWDRAAVPPADWRAPLWWLPPTALPLIPAASQVPAKSLRINGMALQITDSPRGRMWASPAWPPRDADSARVLYETWQALAYPAQPYPMPALSLPASRSAALAMPDAKPAAWLAYALLALFVLERLLSHVRRR